MESFPGDQSLGRVSSVYQDCSGSDVSSSRGGAQVNMDAFLDQCSEACSRPHVMAREASKSQFETALSSFHVFSAVHPEIQREQCAHAEFRSYSADSLVARSSDSSRGMYIIIHGSCIASISGEHQLSTSSSRAVALGRGHAFFEASILPSLAALVSVPGITSSQLCQQYQNALLHQYRRSGLQSLSQALAAQQDAATSCGQTQSCFCSCSGEQTCQCTQTPQFHAHSKFKTAQSCAASPFSVTASSSLSVLYLSASSVYTCVAAHQRKILTNKVRLLHGIESLSGHSQRQLELLAATSVLKCLSYADVVSNSCFVVQGRLEKHIQPLESPGVLVFPAATILEAESKDSSSTLTPKQRYLQPFLEVSHSDNHNLPCMIESSDSFLCTASPVQGNAVCVAGYGPGNCVCISGGTPGALNMPQKSLTFVTSQHALILEPHPLIAALLWEQAFAKDAHRTEIFASVPGLREFQVTASLLWLDKLSFFSADFQMYKTRLKDLQRYIQVSSSSIAAAAMQYENSFCSTLHTAHSEDSAASMLVSSYQFSKWLHLTQPVCVPTLRVAHKHRDIAGYIVLEGDISIVQHSHATSVCSTAGFNSHNSAHAFMVRDSQSALQSEYESNRSEHLSEERCLLDSHTQPAGVDFRLRDMESQGDSVVLGHMTRGSVIGIEHLILGASFHECVNLVNLSENNVTLMPLNREQLELVAVGATETAGVCSFIEQRFPFCTSPSTLAGLALSCRKISHQPNHVLQTQREVPSEVQFVVAGEVQGRLLGAHTGLRPLPVKLLCTGAVLGQAGQQDPATYLLHQSLTYVALNHVQVCTVPIFVLKTLLSGREFRALQHAVQGGDAGAKEHGSVQNNASCRKEIHLTMNQPKVGTHTHNQSTKTPKPVKNRVRKKVIKTHFTVIDRDLPFVPVLHLPTDPYSRFRVQGKSAEFYLHALVKRSEARAREQQRTWVGVAVAKSEKGVNKSEQKTMLHAPDVGSTHTMLNSSINLPAISQMLIAADQAWAHAIPLISRLGPVLGLSTAAAIQGVKALCVQMNSAALHQVHSVMASFTHNQRVRPVPVFSACASSYTAAVDATDEVLWLQSQMKADVHSYHQVQSRLWRKVRRCGVLAGTNWLQWRRNRVPDSRLAEYSLSGVAFAFNNLAHHHSDSNIQYFTAQLAPSVVHVEPLVVRYKPSLPRYALRSSASESGVCFLNTFLYGHDIWRRRIVAAREEYIVSDLSTDEQTRFQGQLAKEMSMMQSHIARNRWHALKLALLIHARRSILMQQFYAYLIFLHEQAPVLLLPKTDKPQEYTKAMLLVLSARVGICFEKTALTTEMEQDEDISPPQQQQQHQQQQQKQQYTSTSTKATVAQESSTSKAYTTRQEILNSIFSRSNINYSNQKVVPRNRLKAKNKSVIYAENAARASSVVGTTVLSIDKEFLEEHGLTTLVSDDYPSILPSLVPTDATRPNVMLSTHESTDQQRLLRGRRLVPQGSLSHTASFGGGRAVAMSSVELARFRRAAVQKTKTAAAQSTVQEQLQRLYYTQAQGGLYTFQRLDATPSTRNSVCAEYSTVNQLTTTRDLFQTLQSVIANFPGAVTPSRVETDHTLAILQHMLPSYVTRSQTATENYAHHDLSKPKLSSDILQVFAPPASDAHLRMWMISELKEPPLSVKFKHMHEKIHFASSNQIQNTIHESVSQPDDLFNHVQQLTHGLPVYISTNKNKLIQLHKHPEIITPQMAQHTVINDANAIKTKRI